jgi:mercuric ion transport protein
MNETRKVLIPGLGGVLAAGASAICCAGPVIAVSLGVSGAGLASTFEPLRPWFLAGTAGLLGAGFWLLHREEKKACEPGRACADPKARRRMKVILWIATVLSVGFATFPRWQGFLL